MAGFFEQYVILTDLDGTVFDEKQNLLQKDLDAIGYFIENGGTFGVSTGRVMVSAAPLVSRLPVNCPCVYLNGGAIMDPRTGEYKYRSFLPECGREALGKIIERFPNLRASALIDHHFYNVTEKHDGLNPFSDDVPSTIEADLATVPGSWYKVLMNVMDHPMEEVDAFCQSLGYPELKFFPSTPSYYEMMNVNNSKAKGNRILMELMGWQDKKLVNIGDYYNDLEMIADADIGAAVAAAPQAVKDVADLVVCDVHEGAMADLISRLEQL